MFAGLNNQNNGGGNTCQTYWRQMVVSYKYLIIVALPIGIASLITGVFGYIFANLVIYTVNYVQIWRLITSFLVDDSIISVVFKLYMLSFSLPIIEKMYSTSYAILQILLQTFMCNIIFIIISQLLSLLEIFDVKYAISFGLIHLVFIFLWEKAALNPEELTKFCFFPCLMPMKYLPWCFFAFFLLFGGNLYTFTSFFFGYIQSMVLKRSPIQLPLAFYNKLEIWMPQQMKKHSGFVSVRDVEVALRSVCYIGRPSSAHQSNNPYQNNNAMDDKVEVVGGGVMIGSSSGAQRRVRPNNPKQSNSEKSDQVAQRQNSMEKEEQPYSQTQGSNQKSRQHFIDNQNETMMSEDPFNEVLNDSSNEEKK